VAKLYAPPVSHACDVSADVSAFSVSHIQHHRPPSWQRTHVLATECESTVYLSIKMCIIILLHTRVYIKLFNAQFLMIWLVRSHVASNKPVCMWYWLKVSWPALTMLFTCIQPNAAYYNFNQVINPQHTCAAWVTVVGLCVCLSVCLSVCLCVDAYSGTTGYEAAY
jgi:hypothetical protein